MDDRDKIAVFDLDGTLSDCKHRMHLIEGKNKNWNRFFERAYKDKPDLEMVEKIKKLRNLGYKIWILTGRPQKQDLISDTVAWLVSNGIFHDKLTMKASFFQKNLIYKKQILKNWLYLGHRIEFIVDDYEEVVETARELGIKAYTPEKFKELKYYE